ncbi:Jag protein [Weizmannia acidilactici]|uniref:RNA-binding protein KhpB n=1 Tax=Weizmannia acidilactici TaxID=2607726 RepID=A0A5J4JF07_9BACI|nr:RNA-binding cell elongation regulator Jag/EloR [Weizmannia acidilactici]GER67302.1 Jag protein [Weizmannia acidilactici]GER70019.1 Jag protein [Weizmannia acidilactici]GER74633.1 Jag protein [Weizmannia acidilactici]
MNEVTTTGQSVEDAVNQALLTLGAEKENVEVEIIDEGKKGVFGLFGAKPAVVRVRVKEDPAEQVMAYLRNIMEKMGVTPKLQLSENDRIMKINIIGDNLPMLIGKRGQTLNALQFLAQLAANHRVPHYAKVMLDVGDYREKREASLVQLAERLAAQVIRTKRKVKLEPMPSFERKIIHSALTKNKNVTTYSEGTEPNRYVVVDLAKH